LDSKLERDLSDGWAHYGTRVIIPYLGQVDPPGQWDLELALGRVATPVVVLSLIYWVIHVTATRVNSFLKAQTFSKHAF
jgi:hypothetical protein